MELHCHDQWLTLIFVRMVSPMTVTRHSSSFLAELLEFSDIVNSLSIKISILSIFSMRLFTLIVDSISHSWTAILGLLFDVELHFSSPFNGFLITITLHSWADDNCLANVCVNLVSPFVIWKRNRNEWKKLCD